MSDEAALLEAWRGGDETAGSALLTRCFPMLYRFFQNKVGLDAEDLIQTTLMDCVSARDRFRGESSFRGFVLKVARNRLYDFLRRKIASPVKGEIGERSVMDLGSRLSRVAARNEQQGLVVEAMRALPVDLQVVLELHYWEEMSATEIAEVVELPVGTVKTRLRRAKELLRERMTVPVSDEDLETSMRAGRELFDPAGAQA